MNIGITCYPTYGGSGIVATELGLELANRGHQVHFISYANPIRLDPGIPRIHYHEVEVFNYPLFQYPPYSLALASRMSEVAEAYDLDLLHVHYAIPHSISALLARQMLAGRRPLPFITTLHGTDITLVGNDRSLFPMTRFALEQSDGITCVSEYLRTKTRDVFNLDRPMEVIPNFVDTRRFLPEPSPTLREHLAPRGERILVHLSNFRQVKRAPDAVRVFAKVRAVMPARLLLIGDGQDRPEALHLAQTLEVKPDVIFLGKQDDVESLLAVADLLLLPSADEAFGLAALEGLSCGVPVVATNVGGVPEVVEDGKSGFLLPVGDVGGMADAALALLTDAPRYAEFRAAARRRAVEHFDIAQIVPRYEAYYRDILGSSP